MSDTLSELARLGSATVYEAGGRRGYVDADLHQVIAGSRVAGPARPVLCAQDDNLMVHAVMPQIQPGEIVVLTMPEPRPVALVGDLLSTQAIAAGAAGLVIDAAIRDLEDLRHMGLAIWARWIRVKGALKATPGTIGEPVLVGGATIRAGDILVCDADGIAVVERERIDEVLRASLAREAKEQTKRAKLRAGETSYDLDGLRAMIQSDGP